MGKDQEFTVKSKGAGGQGKVAAKITGPSSKPVLCKVEPGLSPDNSVVKFIPREEGPYEVDVTYDGVPVPGSPFPVEAVPPTNPSKVGVFDGGEGELGSIDCFIVVLVNMGLVPWTVWNCHILVGNTSTLDIKHASHAFS